MNPLGKYRIINSSRYSEPQHEKSCGFISSGNTQLAAALYLEDRPHLVARTMVNKSPDQVVGNLFGIINLGY